ncbi:hypothetical protein ACSYAD_03100 [Acaryochloris marina NIES-2412]|uniref:hypothetical protein n=1 Tax=Acaryochloris marina TaxID=155978 RepID=UPI0040593666
MRILVTGNAGAGKSTVAERLASVLDAPLISLDTVVWGPHWTKVPKTKREIREAEIAAQQNWIVDGVSFTIQEKADLVIFLDCPRWLSYLRCVRRNVAYLFHLRPGMPPNCPEILIAPTLVRIIWRFPSKVRPRLLKLGSNDSEQRFEWVRSAVDLQRLMEELGVNP